MRRRWVDSLSRESSSCNIKNEQVTPTRWCRKTEEWSGIDGMADIKSPALQQKCSIFIDSDKLLQANIENTGVKVIKKNPIPFPHLYSFLPRKSAYFMPNSNNLSNLGEILYRRDTSNVRELSSLLYIAWPHSYYDTTTLWDFVLIPETGFGKHGFGKAYIHHYETTTEQITGEATRLNIHWLTGWHTNCCAVWSRGELTSAAYLDENLLSWMSWYQ